MASPSLWTGEFLSFTVGRRSGGGALSRDCDKADFRHRECNGQMELAHENPCQDGKYEIPGEQQLARAGYMGFIRVGLIGLNVKADHSLVEGEGQG